MSRNQTSLDGFIPRRPNSRMGDLNKANAQQAPIKPVDRRMRSASEAVATPPTDLVGSPRAGREIGVSDIDESLRGIDTEPSQNDGGKKSRRQRKQEKKDGKKPKSRTRRIVKWVLLGYSYLY